MGLQSRCAPIGEPYQVQTRSIGTPIVHKEIWADEDGPSQEWEAGIGYFRKLS